MTEEKERFQLNLEHAKASHANTQETIRAVDTKLSIITGIVTVTTGFPIAAIGLLISNDTPAVIHIFKWCCICPLWLQVIFILGVCSGIYFGVKGLSACADGLMGRPPEHKQLHDSTFRSLFRWRKNAPPNNLPPFVGLFPHHTLERSAFAQAALKKFVNAEYTPATILAEYADQLLILGSIMAAKIQWSRQAVMWFRQQIVFYFLAALVAIVATIL